MRRFWHDPVFSKVIAAAILSGLIYLWSRAPSLGAPVRAAAKAVWTVLTFGMEVPVGVFILLVIAGPVIASIIGRLAVSNPEVLILRCLASVKYAEIDFVVSSTGLSYHRVRYCMDRLERRGFVHRMVEVSLYRLATRGQKYLLRAGVI